MTKSADKSLEQWLQTGARTMDGAPDLPRGLFDRLRVAQETIENARKTGVLPLGPALLRRAPDETAQARAVAPALTVGRTEGAGSWAFSDPKLSARHFEVVWDGQDALLRDCGSRNGTWVNGVRVTERALRAGDIVEAGGQIFVFVSGGP